MTRRRSLLRGVVALALGGVVTLALGCAGPARPPLPPAPPVQGSAGLASWRQAPALQPEPGLRLAWPAKHARLPSGLGVTVVPRPGTFYSAVYLRVPGAGDRSMGDVAVMVQALRAGTQHGSKAELYVNPQLGQQPVRIRTNAAGTTFSWQVLPRATRTAVELLAEFVLKPAFEPSEVQIRLQQQLADIQAESVDFSSHTQRLARAAIPTLATPSYEDDARGLFQLTPARLKQIHACTILPAGAELVVVGPVAADDVLAWASAAFAGWAAQPPAGCAKWQPAGLPADPALHRLPRAELQLITNTAGDPRLVIEVPGPALSSPDYLPFLLLSKVLAMRRTGAAWELRHAGGSYGIHTSLYEGFPHLTLLEVEGKVDEEAAQPALRGLIADLRGLADNLQERELNAVKRRARSELIETLSSNAELAALILNHTRRGLGVSHMLDAPQELSRVDLARCREVAQRWLSGAEPSMAVTGTLERGLGIRVNIKQRAWTSQLQSHKKAP